MAGLQLLPRDGGVGSNALASLSVTMVERRGAASPCYASTDVMPCTDDMRLADHWLPSLLVLGGFPAVAGFNAFPPLGFALPPCLASVWRVAALTAGVSPMAYAA